MKQYIKVFANRNKIYNIFYEDGVKHTEVIEDSKFEFFIDGNGDYTELVSGQSLKKISSTNMKEHKAKVEKYKIISNIYGNQKPENQFRRREYKDSDINTPLLIGYFDIETAFNGSTLDENSNIVKGIGGFPKPEQANAPITSITMLVKEQYYVLGMKDIERPLDHDAKYLKCKSEKDLLKQFFKLTKVTNIDMLLAWNGEGFDYPFIINRMKYLEMDLSIIDHNGLVKRKNFINQIGQKIETHIPQSYFWMDMLPVYKFLTYTPRESYSLEAIGQAELGEGKINYQDDDMTLEDLYNKNYQKFLNYNIQDVKLLKDLDDVTGLMSLAYDLSYSYGINLEDILATTAPWAQLFYKETYENNQIIDTSNRDTEDIEFEGGNVYCNPGYYEWIMSFDVTSMYPLLGMYSFNISPETLIYPEDLPLELVNLKRKYFNDVNATYDTISTMLKLSKEEVQGINEVLKKHNVSISPSGDYFDLSYVGVLPKMIESIYLGRKEAKKKMFKYTQDLKDLEVGTEDYFTCKGNIIKYNNKQMTLKIQMNSVFGAFGSKYFVLAERAIANSITGYGRYFIRRCQKDINFNLMKKFNYVDNKPTIQIDTDANYYYLSPVVQYLRDKGKITDDMTNMDISDYLAKYVEPILYGIIQKESMCTFKDLFNIRDDKFLGMDREVIASKGFMVGKKNYTLNVLDLEGDRIPKGYQKIVGLNLKKTNLPAFVRKKMLEFLDIFFNGTQVDFQKLYKDFNKEFVNLPAADISFPKGVNLSTDKNRKGVIDIGNDRYLYTLETNGVPIHVRASLIYNKYIKESGLMDKYKNIEDASKIKFVYLKVPNSLAFNSNVIAFPNERSHSAFLEEQNFKEIIDYKKMYNGLVEKPLEKLRDLIQWDYKKTIKIDSFF